MDPKKLDEAVAFMRSNWHLITGDESAYKPKVAEAIRPVFAAAAAGEHGWETLLKKTYKHWSTQVGWRCASSFVDYVMAHPNAVTRAVATMNSPQDADAFWEIALEPVGGLLGLQNGYAQLKAPGTRGALASLVLFSRDHERFPVYRAQISGRPLTALLGEPLDKRTVGSTLESYYRGLERLRVLLTERGLDVRNNLDVQGVLWVVNYNKVA